jgi:hypothetical protein
VSTTVALLTKHNKKKMAFHVSSTFTNPLHKAVINKQNENKEFDGFGKAAKELVLYMSGKWYERVNFETPTSWMQGLCYYLMVRANPEQTLQEVV